MMVFYILNKENVLASLFHSHRNFSFAEINHSVYFLFDLVFLLNPFCELNE